MKDQSQLLIPDKIKVGMVERQDTYTKRLAYVIYYDHKGVIHKEKSWQSWRERNPPLIPPIDYENIPTEGFVLNKDVGGARRSYGWNARNEYVRVYDPRDFEFEISIANLLFVLRECNCSKGKGLEGSFVYAWSGQDLVLLPILSEDYQSSKQFSQLKSKSVKTKELVSGMSYTTKTQETLTYIDRLDYHAVQHDLGSTYRYLPGEQAVSKKFIFWDGKKFIGMDSIKTIAVLASDVMAPDYAELVQNYYRSKNGTRPIRLFLKNVKKQKKKKGRGDYWYDPPECWVYEEENGVFIECKTHAHDNKKIDYIQTSDKIYLKDNALIADNYYTTAYPPHTKRNDRFGYGQDRNGKWVEPTGKCLWVELESGSQFEYHNNQLIDPEEENHNGEED